MALTGYWSSSTRQAALRRRGQPVLGIWLRAPGHPHRGRGYTTRLELEAKLPEDLVEEIQGDYTGIIAYYRDPKTGNEHTVTEGDQSKPRRLRHLYATNATAKRGWSGNGRRCRSNPSDCQT
ncbi:hypothetical protein thsps117_21740 [Pseudomonas sp. No.117]